MVHQIMLFTVTACPVGRHMGTVLAEAKAQHPEIEFCTRYVEVHVEETNNYRVKTHPTVLFLDEQGSELYRVEQRVETEEIAAVIRDLNAGLLEAGAFEENEEVTETYTVCLYAGEDLKTLQVSYHNSTGVKAPRLTALRLLLRASEPGMVNPFPPGTQLTNVQFQEGTAQVTLYVEHMPEKSVHTRMQAALACTLKSFGVLAVDMVLEQQGGENIETSE